MEDAYGVSAALQTLVEQIYAQRQSSDHQANVETAAAGQAAVLVTLLRRCNRQAHLDAREVKQQTAAHKARIDRLQLELQGLHYQQRHLQQAIQRCRDAPHSYSQIQLQPDVELLAARPELKDMNANSREMMEARLQFELETRAALEAERKALGAQKQQLVTENKQRSQDLEALERQLDAFVSSAEALSATLQKN